MLPTFDLLGFTLPSFPLFLLAALSISLLVLAKSSTVSFSQKDFILRSLPLVLISAALGGRVLFAFSSSDSLSSFLYALIHGGEVYYGCLFGGALCLSALCRKANISILETFDACCLSLPLAQAVGRIGCFFNGCCYGIEYSGPFAIPYPIGGSVMTVAPTWFLESAGCTLLFFALRQVHARRNSGETTCTYLILYATLRFAIEFLRGDAIRGFIGPLSTSQAISCAVVIGVLLYWGAKRFQETQTMRKRRNHERVA